MEKEKNMMMMDDDGKLKFEGEYLKGEKNGKGKEYHSNGKLLFEGEYLKNKKWNGKGYDGKNKKVFEITNGKGKSKNMIIKTN